MRRMAYAAPAGGQPTALPFVEGVSTSTSDASFVSQLRATRRTPRDIAVLWIDDRPDTLLFRLLAVHGFVITGAVTGVAGLECVRTCTYDLIVIDLHLPDIHGLTVLQRLRMSGVRTSVLVVTGHYLDIETERYAREAGATAFKYKPLWADEAEDLLRAVAGASGPSSPNLSAAVPRGQLLDADSTASDIHVARLVASLDELACVADGHGDENRERDAITAALLVALSDTVLPLDSFRVCADALRAVLRVESNDGIPGLAARTRDLLRETTRHPLKARQATVRRALSLLIAKPRWWREGDLAAEVASSPSRVGRLLSADLGIEYRMLRRLIVMKAGMVEVLTTDNQFAQIAYRLGMHPGTFDAVFADTFGTCPRELRRFWQRLRT